VNEEGSEAEAATVIVIKAMTASVDPIPKVFEFKADHSFIFFIRDNRKEMIRWTN
jgi:serine protease inhibitor